MSLSRCQKIVQAALQNEQQNDDNIRLAAQELCNDGAENATTAHFSTEHSSAITSAEQARSYSLSEADSDPYTDSGDSYHPSEGDSSSSENDDEGNGEIFEPEREEGDEAVVQNMGRTNEIAKRKRRQESTWARNMIKRKRNRGEEYVNYKGNHVPAKIFAPVLCNCRKKCSDNVLPELQNIIHTQFYALDWNGQTAWICTTVRITAPKRPKKRRNRTPSHKQHSRTFFLNQYQVCKSFFLKVIQISNKRLDYALNKKRDPDTSMPLPDNRGKGPSGNKINDEVKNFIKHHIESFPRYMSHYGDRTSSRQYLAPNLNLQKLYALYKDKCQQMGNIPAKKSFYESIFRSYKLFFYIPKKDTCKTCDIFRVQIQNETDAEKALQIKQEQKDHHLLAAKARDLLNSYKQSSLANNSTSCLMTFDLQRTLPTPLVQTGEVYYLRQLQTLNFGIHLYLSVGEVITMNMWYETTGGRGSQEVISCLNYNLQNVIPANISTLYTFSDSCSGQNRNWYMFHFMMFVVNFVPNLTEIIICYLVSGHSFLPNDSDFSDITKAQKKKEFIYTPDQWMSLVEHCRKKNPYTVNNMVGKFIECKDLSKIMAKGGQSSNGNRVLISKMRKIRFVKGDSKLYFNNDYSQTYDSLELNKSNDESFFEILRSFNPSEGSNTPKPITYVKMQDLKKMLKYVPPIYHPFYLNLPHLNRRGDAPQEENNILPNLLGDEEENVLF